MLAFLLLSRENRWSSKSHHACMFGRVATEVNAVKIRPMGQMIKRLIQKTDEKTEADMTSVFHFLLYKRSKTPNLCQVHKVHVPRVPIVLFRTNRTNRFATDSFPATIER